MRSTKIVDLEAVFRLLIIILHCKIESVIEEADIESDIILLAEQTVESIEIRLKMTDEEDTLQTARDVIEMMMAGAKAVQVGAANLVNPYACKEIIEQLPIEMEKLGIERLSDIKRV